TTFTPPHRTPPSRWRLVYSDISTKGENLVVKVREKNGLMRWVETDEQIAAVQWENPHPRTRNYSVRRFYANSDIVVRGGTEDNIGTHMDPSYFYKHHLPVPRGVMEQLHSYRIYAQELRRKE